MAVRSEWSQTVHVRGTALLPGRRGALLVEDPTTNL